MTRPLKTSEATPPEGKRSDRQRLNETLATLAPQNMHDVHDVVHLVTRLDEVTRRIDGFFRAQLRRMSQAMIQFQASQLESDMARKLTTDFENRQEQWDNDRQSEIERLSDANQKLIDAWEQLEQQQRELVIQQNQLNVGVARSTNHNLEQVADVDRTNASGKQRAQSSNFEIEQLSRELLRFSKKRH